MIRRPLVVIKPSSKLLPQQTSRLSNLQPRKSMLQTPRLSVAPRLRRLKSRLLLLQLQSSKFRASLLLKCLPRLAKLCRRQLKRL